MTRLVLALGLLGWAGARGEDAMSVSALTSKLLPQPRQVSAGEGVLRLAGQTLDVSLPDGPEHDACRTVVLAALQRAGLATTATTAAAGWTFHVGAGATLPALPTEGIVGEGYALAIAPTGLSAAAASPAGLLYAAETLAQLVRLSGGTGSLPALTLRDSPEFRLRGIYIEGGQERFGRIVDPEY